MKCLDLNNRSDIVWFLVGPVSINGIFALAAHTTLISEHLGPVCTDSPFFSTGSAHKLNYIEIRACLHKKLFFSQQCRQP